MESSNMAGIGFPRYNIDRQGNIITVKGVRKQPTLYNGYLRVLLRDEYGIQRPHAVRRLVALMFIPNPKDYKYVKQYDKDPFNLEVTNLYWSKSP